MRIPTVALFTLLAVVAIPATNAGSSAVTPGTAVIIAQETQPATPPADQPAAPQPAPQQAQPQAPSQSSSPTLNVTVDHTDRVWYANPTWIAIGAIAVGLLIVIVVMAARGGSGGPTVVRGA